MKSFIARKYFLHFLKCIVLKLPLSKWVVSPFTNHDNVPSAIPSFLLFIFSVNPGFVSSYSRFCMSSVSLHLVTFSWEHHQLLLPFSVFHSDYKCFIFLKKVRFKQSYLSLRLQFKKVHVPTWYIDNTWIWPQVVRDRLIKLWLKEGIDE